MKEEIEAAVRFLANLMCQMNGQLSADAVEPFKGRLGALLALKYDGHWYPDDPPRGQAYRCLRVNQTDRRDPLLAQATAESGLRYAAIKLPLELTVWIDPGEVSCRFGENRGSYCNVATFKDGKMENYMDHINIEELEETMEAANEAVKISCLDNVDLEATPQAFASPEGTKSNPPRRTYAEICTCGTTSIQMLPNNKSTK